MSSFHLSFRRVCGLLCALPIVSVGGLSEHAIALPGDDIVAVQRWIDNHPSLPPAAIPGTLRVSRSDIPGQRMTFQAWRVLPGFFEDEPVDFIRSEQIEVRDELQLVSPDRLERVLRDLYGSDIHQDYRDAAEVYSYSRFDGRSIPEAAREVESGVLLQGDRFAYWVRLFFTEAGDPVVGQLTLLQTGDRDRLEVYLRREQ
ncbi:MAG: hypothetical protein ACFB9N_11375 [Geitlerinemataceae cyanobacterium]